jgi:hypothetical protein
MSQPESAAPDRLLFGLCLFALGWSVLVLQAGGFTTSIRAGMAFLDWPLSNGSVNPPGWLTEIDKFAEHSHRLAAAGLGLLAIVIAVAHRLRESRRVHPSRGLRARGPGGLPRPARRAPRAPRSASTSGATATSRRRPSPSVTRSTRSSRSRCSPSSPSRTATAWHQRRPLRTALPSSMPAASPRRSRCRSS